MLTDASIAVSSTPDVFLRETISAELVRRRRYRIASGRTSFDRVIGSSTLLFPGVTLFVNASNTSPSEMERCTAGAEYGADEMDVRSGEEAGESRVIKPASDPSERPLV